MHKLIRFFNHNRMKFFLIILVIIFIIFIIRLLNWEAKIELEQDAERVKQEYQNSLLSNDIYEKESETVINDDKVSETYKDDFLKLIDKFLSNCIKGEYAKAYELLSEECIEELYPSEKIFIQQYCDGKFNENRTYSFQSWTNSREYIYQIKIFENPLITGKADSDYIQDYFSVVKEGSEYKLNINGFIGKKDFANKIGEKNGVRIKVNSVSGYMNYEIYEITIQNNTDTKVMIDPRETTDKTFLIDENNAKHEAFLHENLEDDLIANPQSNKTLRIKFNNVYQNGKTVEKIVFSNIVFDYEKFQQDKENYKEFGEIEVEL